MDKTELSPYIFFRGNCEEAMNFYKSVFGGKLDIVRYEDAPNDFEGKAEMSGKIMNCALTTDGGFVIMASDAQHASETTKKVELCLSGSDEQGLRKVFDGLAEGGKVKYPLKKEFWGDTFGTLSDRFGVDWMMNITTAK